MPGLRYIEDDLYFEDMEFYCLGLSGNQGRKAQTVKSIFSNEQLYTKLGWDLNAWATIYIEDDLLFSLLHTSKATFSFPTDH